MCAEEASSSEDEEEEDAVPAKKDAAVVDTGVSDMDYLRSRVTSKFEESASDEDNLEDEDAGIEGALSITYAIDD